MVITRYSASIAQAVISVTLLTPGSTVYYFNVSALELSATQLLDTTNAAKHSTETQSYRGSAWQQRFVGRKSLPLPPVAFVLPCVWSACACPAMGNC